MSDFSNLQEFYRYGLSLWRWIKYGNGTYTPYIDPFSQESLYTPSAPFIQERINKLITSPMSLPIYINNRVIRFCKIALKNFIYPGDGYIFFMDPYLSPIATESMWEKHTDRWSIYFYNYLYSYRHLITPALHSYLSNIDPLLIKFYYEYRFHIFKDISFFSTLNEICRNKISQDKFSLILLERLYIRSMKSITGECILPSYITLSNVLGLLKGYTVEATRHILSNPHASNQSVINSINLITQTRSLTQHDLPYKFSSPSALRRFHDAEATRLLNKNIQKDPHLYCKYSWPNKLLYLVTSVTQGEWYIPIIPIELISRGQSHHNCVGSYYNRHFEKPTGYGYFNKTLILFSSEAEAEFRLFFKKKITINKSTGEPDSKTVCTKATLVQCTTKYNKSYSSSTLKPLENKFIGCDAELFVPSIKKEGTKVRPSKPRRFIVKRSA